MVLHTSLTNRGDEGPMWGPSPTLPRSDLARSHPRIGALPRQRVDHGVDLAVETVDPDTGLRLRHVVVSDECDGSITRQELQAVMSELDRELLAHPDWLAPAVRSGHLDMHNPASQWFYASPALREWRTALVPSARALYPMQRPELTHLPSGAPVDAAARAVFRDCVDAVGIRSRASILQEVVQHAWERLPHDARRPRWVSLACGAAVPVLDTLRTLGAGEAAHPFLDLVDIDTQALDFARMLAQERGLREGEDFRLLERNLVSTVVSRTTLLDELGVGNAMTVDAVGIFEYFRDAACARLLRNGYRMLAPGGVLVVANMLSDRPQLAFNQRAAGWPHIVPRSVDQLVELVRRAGLPLDRTTVSIPADGVYAVVDITR